MTTHKLKGSAVQVAELLDELGLPYTVEQTRHYKIRVTMPNGRKRIIVASVSPSDHRSTKNKIAQTKRLLRSEGIDV